MRYIQQNTFLLVKDTKTSTLIESKPCDEKGSATGPIKTNLKAACSWMNFMAEIL